MAPPMKLQWNHSRVVILAAFLFALTARTAYAGSFTFNFCPGAASCPANVTQARLTFTENLITPDPNDYVLDLKIVGGAGDPTFIDQISFTIDAADNVTGAGGYEVKPTLLSAPGGIANWSVFYDNVNNGSDLWEFSVDLADDIAGLGVGSAVNLRAAFLNANGKNGGILSPGGGGLVGCNGADCDNIITSVPEPASIALFGTGLLLAARVRGRRRNR